VQATKLPRWRTPYDKPSFQCLCARLESEQGSYAAQVGTHKEEAAEGQPAPNRGQRNLAGEMVETLSSHLRAHTHEYRGHKAHTSTSKSSHDKSLLR